MCLCFIDVSVDKQRFATARQVLVSRLKGGAVMRLIFLISWGWMISGSWIFWGDPDNFPFVVLGNKAHLIYSVFEKVKILFRLVKLFCHYRIYADFDSTIYHPGWSREQAQGFGCKWLILVGLYFSQVLQVLLMAQPWHCVTLLVGYRSKSHTVVQVEKQHTVLPFAAVLSIEFQQVDFAENYWQKRSRDVVYCIRICL